MFRVSRPEGFQFSPGQSVKVGLRDLRRSYSIVSAPHEPFGYREELAALAEAHPDLLTYLCTFSRPAEARNQGWPGHTGRVDTLVDDILGHHGLSPQNTLVYACGHSGMLEAVAGQVQPQGFRLETGSYD